MDAAMMAATAELREKIMMKVESKVGIETDCDGRTMMDHPSYLFF
jgi:hypothetical protein